MYRLFFVTRSKRVQLINDFVGMMNGFVWTYFRALCEERGSRVISFKGFEGEFMYPTLVKREGDITFSVFKLLSAEQSSVIARMIWAVFGTDKLLYANHFCVRRLWV